MRGVFAELVQRSNPELCKGVEAPFALPFFTALGIHRHFEFIPRQGREEGEGNRGLNTLLELLRFRSPDCRSLKKLGGPKNI
jgi:hypothetical protein